MCFKIGNASGVMCQNSDDLDTLTKAIQRREYYLLPKAIENVKQRL